MAFFAPTRISLRSTAFLAAMAAVCALGDAGPQRPPSLRPLSTMGLEIDEKVTRNIDLDMTFRDESGAVVPLRSFFKQGRPVLIDLVYYRCPQLCNLMLNGQVITLRDLPFEPGKDYELVTVSIDPKETPELAREKKESYAKTFHRPTKGWHFLTDYEDHSKSLASLVGFKYRFDPKLNQYIHAAAFMVLTEDGKISRYLYGTRFKVFDMRMAITEAGRGETRSGVEKLLAICYQYDPNAKGYVVAATRLMQGTAAIMLLGFGFWLWRFFQWEKLRSAQGLNQLRPKLNTGEVKA